MSYYDANLIAEIDRYLLDTGISEVTFGRKALGDPHFVRQLRGGRDVRMSTLQKVRRFMATDRADSDHALTVSPESDGLATSNIIEIAGDSVRGAD